MSLLLRLTPTDDVAVLRREVEPGELIDPEIFAQQRIPAGHKAVLRDLPAGAEVHKYGQVIGVTTQPVRAGDHLHTSNLPSSTVGLRVYQMSAAAQCCSCPAICGEPSWVITAPTAGSARVTASRS